MLQNTLFSIRPMMDTDLEQAFNLSLSEGWNQTMTDWRFFLDNSGNICIVAEKENRICGTATALIHDRKLAWIGMVLVDKSLRGQGAGRMLLEHILEKLRGMESVKLDATPAGEPLYSKLGFIPEYRIHRMTFQNPEFTADSQKDPAVSNIGPGDIQNLISFDRPVFGVDRGPLLNSLAMNFPEKGFQISEGKKIAGFIQGRKGSRFTYLGPLTATSDTAAAALMTESLKLHRTSAIAIDVPADQSEFIDWLKKAGFVAQRQFTRMYLNRNPFPGLPENQYLISGPEFG